MTSLDLDRRLLLTLAAGLGVGGRPWPRRPPKEPGP